MEEMILIKSSKLQHLIEETLRKVLKETALNKPDPAPMTISEASDYLKVSVSTVYRYTSKHLIPYHKPGKIIYFLREELDHWLVSNKKHLSFTKKLK